MSVVVIIGNPSPGGRTSRTGAAVGAAIAAARGEGEAEVIELATIAGGLFEWGNPAVAELTAKVAAADVIVATSPTFKATYSGLLKAFLDNYGNDALAGCRAVPVMLGAAPQHALAPEVHLRPLLVELGASVPTRGLYVLESQVDELDSVVAAWAETATPLLLG
ncbi:MAG: NAD(P)H-dependent oxidoreductase [Acidimicrobiales bacterium]